MKLFEFDPTTGQRGAHIDDMPIPNVIGSSVEYMQTAQNQMHHINWVKPNGFGPDARVEVHCTADRNDSDPYNLEDQWVCFCIGKVKCGIDSWWEWIILPPLEV